MPEFTRILTGIFLPGVFLLVTMPVHANDIDDVHARAELWAESIGIGDPDLMASLYDEDAILHGTGSPIVRRGTALIRKYFAAQFGDNEPVVLRYSFVYRKIDDQWMIIDHHSSRLPE